MSPLEREAQGVHVSQTPQIHPVQDHKHELSDQGWCVFVFFFQPRLLLSFCFNFSFFCSPNKDILSNLGFVVMPVLIQYNCTSIPLKATFAKVDISNFCFCFYFSCHSIFSKQSLLEKTIYFFLFMLDFMEHTAVYAHNPPDHLPL